jgi:hypothetical protein
VFEIEGIEGSTLTQILRAGTVHVIRHDPSGRVHPARPLTIPSRPDDAMLQDLTAGLDEWTPVEVLHAADVGAVSWETVFSYGAGSSPVRRPIWRRLKRSNRRPYPTKHRGWPTAVLTPDPGLAKCWEGRAVPLGTADTEIGVFEALRTARIIHLIGSPVEERRGVAFPYTPSLHRLREKESRYATAKELLSQWEGPELVIVQGPPDIEYDLDTWSREQAAYLRQLGSEFAQEGVPAVLMLPGFRHSDWLEVTHILTESLRLDGIDGLTHDRLLHAVREFQDALLGRGDDRRVEEALAACLFVSDVLMGSNR